MSIAAFACRLESTTAVKLDLVLGTSLGNVPLLLSCLPSIMGGAASRSPERGSTPRGPSRIEIYPLGGRE